MSENEHRAVQGSAEWLRERRCSFGGSELACLFGLNRYRKKKDGVLDKIIQAYEGGINNIAMSWGTLFEDVHRRYMEKVLGVQVFETGAIPSTLTKFHKYSPDGLCVVQREQIRKVICNPASLDGVAEEVILLLEQKQVTTRTIKRGMVPDYYLPQIKGGMCTISLAEFGLYTECSLGIVRSGKLGEEDLYGNVFGIFSRFGEPHYMIDKHCLGGYARGTVVIRSDDLDFVAEQKKFLSENLITPTTHRVYEALDIKCATLHSCIMAWARHPKLTIDRETFFDSWKSFDLDAENPDVILVIPWVVKELNMVGVPKQADYLELQLAVLEKAGNFLEFAHKWIEDTYPDASFTQDPAEKQRVLDFLSAEYDRVIGK